METTRVKQAKWATSAEIERGTSLLLQASILAEQVHRESWDFAVEIATLHAAGMSNSDLRWMICKGYIEHAFEQTESLEKNRRFRKCSELSFNHRSCFVLTEKGHRYARQVVANTHFDRKLLSDRNGTVRPDTVPEQIERPTWDAGRHQLRVGEIIVKEYKLPSPNQETILAAFEEEDWPPSVDDPLPVHPDLDPRRRLHDTIKSLNRNQRCYLIRFMGDGSGEGVRWEWIKRRAGA